ncbi:cupin domain-containing protein [Bacillus sp. V5-8f]|uniref:cupin domain-containing protein n=1 Tax=Bacillus sp. V5-8f TaxID=2053044 RepID=UPI000C7635AD|nr:cupin domain-containing protein [Bacillus sp. V5-8f]PLT33090.1 cupin domain-containing protein [Bacillus sp. V5-8f]
MEVLKIDKVDVDPLSAVPMRNLFEKMNVSGNLKMGTVSIPAGKRVPVEGVSKHTENEYSIIVKGSLAVESGGTTYRISSGDATFIPAGEEHIAFNDGEEDCEIIWVLVG